jgi:hypothetical protein
VPYGPLPHRGLDGVGAHSEPRPGGGDGGSLGGGRNLLLPFVDSLTNRDLFLFMKMREKGEVISFEKEKFGDIFDVRVRL